jgi:cytosine/adenosine deaminase-related metal-dependent hydrolase
MLLRNLSIPGNDGLKDILVVNNEIQFVSSTGSLGTKAGNHISVSFNHAIAFPGLINSHDHLDFNLFPRIGNKIYSNYTEWGYDIHMNNKEEISRVLQIPRDLRVLWGIYKNLLNGITTVVNHGDQIKTGNELINIFQNSYSLHSPAFEKRWKWKVNHPLAGNRPFVMHIGEGTDALSHREITKVIRWNFFKRKIIGIHGVAMDPEQAKSFHALVWCPVSNYFLQQKTAAIEQLKNQLPILFGTDSTLTADWNLWDHIRIARSGKQLTDVELLNTLTTVPAEIWGIPNTGRIAEGHFADIVIADIQQDLKGMNAFFAINPEDILLIIRHGKIRLFDSSFFELFAEAGFAMIDFKPVSISHKRKYIYGDLPGLIRKIREYYPGALFPVTPE